MAKPVAQVTTEVRTTDSRLWPYSRRTALLAIPIVLIVLALGAAAMRAAMNWPPSSADSLVLTGILFLSLVPLLLVVVDMVSARGGAVELPFVKVSFAAAMAPTRTQSITIAANIGVPGTPIMDSGSQLILDSMSKAASNDIVVVDLESGHAWWETRLVVLCAGAARLLRPSVIVFVATEEEVPRRFQGWARPEALLALLLDSTPHYHNSFLEAQVAAAQWAVVVPPGPGGQPLVPIPLSPLAQQGTYVVPFINGQPNPMAAEQFLALSLGQYEQTPVNVNVVHLKGSYAAVLHFDSIDRTWPPDRQTASFLNSEAPYVAITDAGQYLGLLGRATGQNMILRGVLQPGSGAS